MHILVVDDSRVMRRIVSRTLKSAGFAGHHISEAADGVEALQAARRQRPDLILSDWNMPGLNGLELLRSLHDQGQRTPFGFVTTECDAERRRTALEAGALFVLTKPFTPESFQAALSPHLV